jgi:cation diffusion facilitator family transporter
VHSLADLGSNGFALAAAHISSEPPDRDHPYGHRKFETLAVFVLATLLSVLAIEIAVRSLGRESSSVTTDSQSLALMLGVLAVNVSITLWEGWRAHQLDSDLLRADTRHTLSDVLTTVAVIAGWQLSAAGVPWLDSVMSFIVAALILFLAYGLFQRSIPVLVDSAAADPDEVSRLLYQLSGVEQTRRVRSRRSADGPRVDVVIGVDSTMSTAESHNIADAVERSIRDQFGASEVIVHVEPVTKERQGPRED